ncbi:glycosyl hydrolase 108 family protein [Paraburkholderia sp. SIMBA_049]
MPITRKHVGIGAVAASIIAAVLGVEGGYVNDSHDPGGETNHGITKQVAVAHGYTGPMKNLSQALASSIYFEDYIQKPGFEPFLELSPAVAQELVDSAVNTGPARPSLWLQKALNSLNRNGRDFPQTNVDGKVGPGTIQAYQALQRLRGRVQACELVVKLLDAQQAVYYMSLTSLSQYTTGWVSNRIGNVPLERCKEEGEAHAAT